jgi:hypothetical protein
MRGRIYASDWMNSGVLPFHPALLWTGSDCAPAARFSLSQISPGRRRGTRRAECQRHRNGRDMTLSGLVAAIESGRQHGNLSSAIRLFVLDFYRNRLSDCKDGRGELRDVLTAGAATGA